jgi:hypothetical protein
MEHIDPIATVFLSAILWLTYAFQIRRDHQRS